MLVFIGFSLFLFVTFSFSIFLFVEIIMFFFVEILYFRLFVMFFQFFVSSLIIKLLEYSR